ncbi:protein MEI2-like 2 [Rutidosis leptorrhynchoides]|uniref:protein MEI2-like 2 n=1 Tax=Rutidosis leptorrhynchoides TaxID=125765 RepID=UPI003A9A3046
MMTFSKVVGSGTRRTIAGFDASLYSSSLPVLHNENMILNNNGNGHHQFEEDKDLLEDIKDRIRSVLPEEDDLLAGAMDGFDLNSFPNRVDESEDFDLFGSGGGMELESDTIDNLNIAMSNANLGDGFVANNGLSQFNLQNGGGTVVGEHPYGEHPSRTLFVRNINSNVEDSELSTLFEQYGDIRTLYTACKHRGFVMISYYDIRAARTAMRALQNKPLRRRKLDIHYSIPKDNPSDKDINQGTLVAFNLDPSVSCEDLLQIFGVYGEVKEIRETPHKRHHKFIEYYDVRAAEAALRCLNRSDIAGKRIKLEPSRPGGARRNLMLQLSQEFDQDDTQSFRLQVGPSISNSPPGVWPQFGSPIEHNPMQTFSKSPIFGSTSSNSLPSGLASILHAQPSRTQPIGKDPRITSYLDQIFQQSHSLQDSKLSQFNGSMSSFGGSSSTASGIETLSGSQFLWGSPGRANHGLSTTSQPYTRQPGPFFGSSQQHLNIGSAPPGIPFEQHFGRYHESPEALFMSPPSYGGLGIGAQADRGFFNARGSGNIMENGSPSFSNMSPRMCSMFLGNGHYPGLGSMNFESMSERGRTTRRVDLNADNKKQFQLDLDRISTGEDTRTTLMIKNIPNKYTSKMLLAAIDENHSGTYDFLYLPIDFKNKCNVGYAFINMLSPMHIIPFYQEFNGKKWEKFNSEKVASLAYARIQGKAALITHFQNSSLMNEDKRCRPILFQSEGLESFDQEPQLGGSLNVQAHPYSVDPLANSSSDDA